MSTIKHFTIQYGRRFAFTGTITQGGAAFDLTDYTLRLFAKKNKEDTTLVLDQELAIVSAPAGTYSGVITNEESKILYGKLVYEVAVFKAGGYVYSPTEGVITVDRTVETDPS